MTEDQSQLESDAGAVDEPATVPSESGLGSAGTEPPAAAAAPPARPEPVIPPPDPEMLEARQHVLDTTTRWLVLTLEQPILRALTTNADHAIVVADRFPALRAALKALQDEAPGRVADAIGPILDQAGQMRDQMLISNVESAVAQLVGLIGGALKEGGFDPLSAGLERIQDGYRAKSLGEHGEISAALIAYNERKASIVAARAEQIERDREATRLEVERLWKATDEVS